MASWFLWRPVFLVEAVARGPARGGSTDRLDPDVAVDVADQQGPSNRRFGCRWGTSPAATRSSARRSHSRAPSVTITWAMSHETRLGWNSTCTPLRQSRSTKSPKTYPSSPAAAGVRSEPSLSNRGVERFARGT